MMRDESLTGRPDIRDDQTAGLGVKCQAWPRPGICLYPLRLEAGEVLTV